MGLDKGVMQSRDGLSEAELYTLESRLRKEGYRLVQKESEKDLIPGEYVKRSHSKLPDMFGGPVVWQVLWCTR